MKSRPFDYLFWKLIVAALLAVAYENTNAAESQVAVDSTQTCATYHQLLSNQNGFVTGAPLPRKLEKLVKSCPDSSDIALVLQNFFAYHKIMMQRDFPNSMALSQNSDPAAIYKKDVKQLEQLLADIKKQNSKDVSAILQFMTKQSENRYTYAWAALEIVARGYPQDYESYQLLTQPGTEGRRAWEVNKDRWLKSRTN